MGIIQNKLARLLKKVADRLENTTVEKVEEVASEVVDSRSETDAVSAPEILPEPEPMYALPKSTLHSDVEPVVQPQFNFAAPECEEPVETRVSVSFDRVSVHDDVIRPIKDDDSSVSQMVQANTEVDLKVEAIAAEVANRSSAKNYASEPELESVPESIPQTLKSSGSILDSLLASDWHASDDNLVFSERKTSDMSIATEDSFRLVAENPSTPPTTLNWMAGQVSVDVRSAVAGNINTPQETLRRLASDNASEVRQRVANNRRAGSDILRLLSNDKNKVVAGEARSNLVKKLKTCEMEVSGANLLTTHKFKPTSNLVASTHNALEAMPAPVLQDKIIEPATASGEWHALGSDDAKQAYKKQKDTVKDLKFNAASVYDRSAVTTPRKIVSPSPGDTVAFQTMVAARTTTPPERLMELAMHQKEAVRRAVAENVAAPVEALMILARDKAREVRLRLVENYSCPMDLIRFLENDVDPFVSYEARKVVRRADHISATEARTFHVNPAVSDE